MKEKKLKKILKKISKKGEIMKKTKNNNITWRVSSVTIDRYSLAEYDRCPDIKVLLTGTTPLDFGLHYGPTDISRISDEINRALNDEFKLPAQIKKVVYNNPATIILWKDGSKTVVKCQEGDTYDPETGFVMAYLKKMLGNDNTFNKEIAKHVPMHEIVKEQTQEDVKDQDYYKLQQERAKLMRIIDNPRMTKKAMAELISEVVDGIDNIVMGMEVETLEETVEKIQKNVQKRDTNFKVGDRVRIRSWDDMEKEFGLDLYGNIECECAFTIGMKHLCGTEFTITGFDIWDNKVVHGSELAEKDGWDISTDMIEKVN